MDILLYRPIKDGKQYNKLIPESQCKSTFLGEGDTAFSVSEMAGMVKEYSWHMAKVAPMLQKRSLQQTCNAIHDFAYWHFQYKADGADQMLRSPACSWHSRYDGIDCKSYSILVSCILVNLGISHYIRRIQQPGDEPGIWSHVYVVVPTDQQSGKLAKGYHTIDGTLATVAEPIFTQKSDLYMALQHYGLKGARALHGTPGLRGLNLSQIKTFLFPAGWSPSCINGSLNDSHFSGTMTNAVAYFESRIAAINQGAQSGSQSLITAINDCVRYSTALEDHARRKAGGNWKSECSRSAVNGYKELGAFYKAIMEKGLMGWVATYFDVTTTIATAPNNTYPFTIVGFGLDSDVAQISYTAITSIKPKANIAQIKAFELTPYVATRSNQGSSFNINTFLQGLPVLVNLIGGGSSSGSNSGGGSVATPGIVTGYPQGGTVPTIPAGGGTAPGTIPSGVDPITLQPYPQSVSKAGFSVAGWILVVAGLGYGFTQMKAKPATKKATVKN